MSISASDNVGIPYFGWADVTDLDIKNTSDGFYFSDWGTIRTNNLENASTNVWCNKKSMWDGGKFPIGTTTITCKAWDASNNGVESSFTITVVDSSSADTPPAQNYDVFLSILNTQGNNNVNHNPVTTINVGDSVTLIFGTDGAGMGTDYSHYRFDAQWMNGSCGPSLSGITCLGSIGWGLPIIPSYTHTFDQVGTYQYDISHIDRFTDFLGTIM